MTQDLLFSVLNLWHSKGLHFYYHISNIDYKIEPNANKKEAKKDQFKKYTSSFLLRRAKIRVKFAQSIVTKKERNRIKQVFRLLYDDVNKSSNDYFVYFNYLVIYIYLLNISLFFVWRGEFFLARS